MKMHCPNCEKEVEEDAKFCGYCGYELINEEEIPTLEEKIQIERQMKSGAAWFFWIAGLSLINSIIIHSGWSFIIGLGLLKL
jgi:uncharacterized membrane protein YvbJ